MVDEVTLEALEGRPTSVLIADRLRERIIDGTFRPGEQIREASLVEQLKVSRGPVREALQRLSQEGLLESRRNRGVFVVELTPRDVEEIYAARAAIELAAARGLLAKGPERVAAAVTRLSSIVDGMTPLVAAGDWKALAEQDMKFHLAFVEAAENSRLERIFSTLAAESRICIANLQDSYPHADALVAEHRNLVDLLQKGEEEPLRKAIRQHMKDAVTDLTRSFEAAAAVVT